MAGDKVITKAVYHDTYDAISPTNIDLSSKAVFICGASRGIGKAIAISFARGGASSIAIGARSDLSGVEGEMMKAAQAAGRKPPHVLRLKLDVVDPESVASAVSAIKAAFGRLDTVIHNAAVFGPGKLIGDSKPDEWWNTMEVNVRGPYLTLRAVLPLLLDSANGLKTFITIGSVGAFLVLPSASQYQTSKLAALRLMEFAAAEYQDKGLVAYSVHPGTVATNIMDTYGELPDEVRAMFIDKPELCGDSIVYLAQEKRDWLSGRYVSVNWDMPELVSDTRRDEIVNGDKLKVRLVV